jgi:kumamolisin
MSSGGGKSIYFSRPPWQKGAGVTGRRRLVPDVSATADPEEGGLVILHGVPHQYGGTSWSAPIWAGICALLNAVRKNNGRPPLPFLNPFLYPLADLCFQDILDGSNGVYHAKQGYDLVTGLGSPNVAALIKELALGPA